jgi:hypothetical protein
VVTITPRVSGGNASTGGKERSGDYFLEYHNFSKKYILRSKTVKV